MPISSTGITFMTGGQSEKDSTVHLNAINKFPGRKPWVLTFCFARALQTSVLLAWSGRDDQVNSAQGELLKRAKVSDHRDLGSIKHTRYFIDILSCFEVYVTLPNCDPFLFQANGEASLGQYAG